MTLLPDVNSADCRSRVIQAATEVFIEDGYRASIDRVAARAGVARQTLYNHFPSKADLFGEVVRLVTDALLVTLDGNGFTLRERLLRFGIAYRLKLLSVEGLGFYRAVVSEATRFPELVDNFYRTGPMQTAARLAIILQRAMDDKEIRQDNPAFATSMLLSMLVGNDRSRYLCSGEPSPAEEPILVGRIIDCYLRAFAIDTELSTATLST